MATKSGVSNIFAQFKKFVETGFHKPIKTLYSDNGGEFIILKSYFSRHGITHYTTALYPPTKWCLRTPSPSHCGNGPYTTSRCKP
jgi:hypothetical protein